MAILRNRTQESFTIITNNILRDQRLSLKARGLLCTMLSLPDNWNFSEAGLCAILQKDGITSIKSGLKELQEVGYLRRYQDRGKDGSFNGYVWEVYDVAVETGENPLAENPTTVSPTSENLDQLSTNESNTDVIERDKAQPKRFQKPTVEQVRAYCQERRNSIDAEEFVDFYESKGWLVGKTPMKDWKASVRTWERSRSGNRYSKPKKAYVNPDDTTEWPSEYF